jgi:hypothetical protein
VDPYPPPKTSGRTEPGVLKKGITWQWAFLTTIALCLFFAAIDLWRFVIAGGVWVQRNGATKPIDPPESYLVGLAPEKGRSCVNIQGGLVDELLGAEGSQSTSLATSGRFEGIFIVLADV